MVGATGQVSHLWHADHHAQVIRTPLNGKNQKIGNN